MVVRKKGGLRSANVNVRVLAGDQPDMIETINKRKRALCLSPNSRCKGGDCAGNDPASSVVCFEPYSVSVGVCNGKAVLGIE